MAALFEKFQEHFADFVAGQVVLRRLRARKLRKLKYAFFWRLEIDVELCFQALKPTSNNHSWRLEIPIFRLCALHADRAGNVPRDYIRERTDAAQACAPVDFR
jgi:hypothetical protein